MPKYFARILNPKGGIDYQLWHADSVEQSKVYEKAFGQNQVLSKRVLQPDEEILTLDECIARFEKEATK